jgi:hypothetical protein
MSTVVTLLHRLLILANMDGVQVDYEGTCKHDINCDLRVGLLCILHTPFHKVIESKYHGVWEHGVRFHGVI